MPARMIISCLVTIWNHDDPRNKEELTVFLIKETLWYYNVTSYYRPIKKAERYERYHIRKLVAEDATLSRSLSSQLQFHVEPIK